MNTHGEWFWEGCRWDKARECQSSSCIVLGVILDYSLGSSRTFLLTNMIYRLSVMVQL